MDRGRDKLLRERRHQTEHPLPILPTLEGGGRKQQTPHNDLTDLLVGLKVKTYIPGTLCKV